MIAAQRFDTGAPPLKLCHTGLIEQAQIAQGVGRLQVGIQHFRAELQCQFAGSRIDPRRGLCCCHRLQVALGVAAVEHAACLIATCRCGFDCQRNAHAFVLAHAHIASEPGGWRRDRDRRFRIAQNASLAGFGGGERVHFPQAGLSGRVGRQIGRRADAAIDGGDETQIDRGAVRRRDQAGEAAGLDCRVAVIHPRRNGDPATGNRVVAVGGKAQSIRAVRFVHMHQIVSASAGCTQSDLTRAQLRPHPEHDGALAEVGAGLTQLLAGGHAFHCAAGRRVFAGHRQFQIGER